MEKSKTLIRRYAFTEEELRLNLRIEGTIESVCLTEIDDTTHPTTLHIKTSEIKRD